MWPLGKGEKSALLRPVTWTCHGQLGVTVWYMKNAEMPYDMHGSLRMWQVKFLYCSFTTMCSGVSYSYRPGKQPHKISLSLQLHLCKTFILECFVNYKLHFGTFMHQINGRTEPLAIAFGLCWRESKKAGFCKNNAIQLGVEGWGWQYLPDHRERQYITPRTGMQ